MNDEGTVNSRVVDSVSSVVTLLTGQSPSQAFGMLDAVMVETLGMAMHNAVGRQQGAGMVSSAAVTAACAKMLQTPYPILAAVPPIEPLDPPSIQPLPGPPPTPPPSTAATIAAAYAEGEAAIGILQAEAMGSGVDVAQAQADLALLAKAAATPPIAPIVPPIPPLDPILTRRGRGKAARRSKL